MGNQSYTFEHYTVKAHLNNLELLMRPDEIPATTDEPALWRCKITGIIFDRSFHTTPSSQSANSSPGQRYWQKYKNEYYKVAAYYGLEFIYDPLIDYAPYDTRTPVKWRTRSGQCVVLSLHTLKYGKKLRKAVAKMLGIPENTPTYTEAAGRG
jgi:hypothetical protein